MKRLSLLSVVFLPVLCCAFLLQDVQAQTFSVKGKKLEATGQPGSYVDTYAEVKNLTSSEIQIRVQRTSATLPEGWAISFCLVNCYSPEAVDVTEPVPADGTFDFKATWETNAVPGEGEVTYLLSNAANPSEKFTVTFRVNTSTVSAERPQLPRTLTLAQNYPNPFSVSGSAVTQINYSMPKSGFVTLKLYNLVGREIRTLVAETKQTGSYTAMWDGRDDRGELVPSGIYVYKLTNGGGGLSRRMLVSR